MAFAHGEPENATGEEVTASEAAAAADALEEIPEITLDSAIQEKIESSKIENPDQTESVEHIEAVPQAVEKNPATATKADAELEKIAAELAKAKTIEDVDDRLAETLFGEEINLIAAQVLANGATGEPANDEELKLFDTATASMAQSAGTPHSETVAPKEAPIKVPEAPPIEVSLETKAPEAESGMDLSASQRLKTVRALNADLHPSLREPTERRATNGASATDSNGSQPEPIEDQINTSITQTLKALKVKPPTLSQGDDDEDTGKKTGFFSRFKRS
jgi:hypothetical protein